MATTEMFNLQLAHSTEEVDRINKKFYGRFNYPWPPVSFPAYPSGIANLFLNQDIGFWGHDRVPDKPKILVAGCGTNQALYTALKYPHAEVLGVDISTESLSTCRRNADQMGVRNLQLEEKSLNALGLVEEFDYVICTGVVHHNADPLKTLCSVAQTLKRNGIMEFMVYNYYHRILPVACQKAVRNFNSASGKMDLDDELSVIKALIARFPYQNLMGSYLKKHLRTHDSHMADMLLQPVEYSYTIETLQALSEGANLECLIYCPNHFDVGTESMNWNIKMDDPWLQERYDALSDVKRWQIANLLMMERSPMLWFYMQRKDSDFVRKTEQQICEEFLQTIFKRSSFPVKNYMLNSNGDYIQSDKTLKYPLIEIHNEPLAAKILALVDGRTRMKDILHKLSVRPTFSEISELRMKLTTILFPYLLANGTGPR